jgi:hypothetical protein
VTAAPFVTGLRTPPGALHLTDDAGAWAIRAQLAEVWDAVRLDVSPRTTVAEVKRAALGALVPEGVRDDAIVVKLNGFEVLDESVALADAGVRNGSTLLLSYRHRRPVR